MGRRGEGRSPPRQRLGRVKEIENTILFMVFDAMNLFILRYTSYQTASNLFSTPLPPPLTSKMVRLTIK